MSRCEGYYRVENRRCDRDAVTTTHAVDGEYAVCEYHRRESGPVARWIGETSRRTTPRLGIRPAA